MALSMGIPEEFIFPYNYFCEKNPGDLLNSGERRPDNVFRPFQRKSKRQTCQLAKFILTSRAVSSGILKITIQIFIDRYFIRQMNHAPS